MAAQRFPIISGQVGLGPPIALLLGFPVVGAVMYLVYGDRTELPIWIGLTAAAELLAVYVLIVAIGMKGKAIVVAEDGISIPRWWSWRPLILEWAWIDSFRREDKDVTIGGNMIAGPLYVVGDKIVRDEQLVLQYFGASRKVTISNDDVFAFDDLERAVQAELAKHKPAA